MEDTEKRRNEEKDRRLQEQRRILGEKQEATEIIAARGFAQSYLQNLLPSVYDSLASNGYFYDKIERELESSTLPWLTAEVNQRMEASSLAERLTDGIFSSLFRYHLGSHSPLSGRVVIKIRNFS